jgi:alkyl hydroperoxide reductase subunit AhpC
MHGAAAYEWVMQVYNSEDRDMTIHLGDEAPNFTAVTTDGTIDFHEWKAGSWAVLFSHPADFTPVCTTELGRTAGLKSEFEKRNVKVLALSVDPVEDHNAWAPDISDVTGNELNFPIIADPEKKVSELYDMIHPGEGDTSTVRSVFVIDANDKVRLTLTYPKSVGRNFDELLRVIDALQLTDREPVSTPVDWVSGQKLIVSPAMSTDDAKERFGEGNVEEVKPYLRWLENVS